MVHIAALVASFVPALLWLWFFYSRDRYEREPKSLIGKLFLWGLLAGPWAAGMNELLGGTLVQAADHYGTSGAIPLAITLLLISIVLLGLNEETMKYLVATNSVRNNPNFNERVDGMVYLTTAALGFAAGENFIYIIGSYFGVLRSAAEAGAPPGAATGAALVSAFAVTAPLRAFLSTIGHVTWSGIVGYFLAEQIVEGRSGRAVLGGLLLAAGLHSAYDFPLFLRERLGGGSGFVATFFSSYFLVTLLVWVISLGIYVFLFRRALAASPFRTKQLATGPPPPGPAPKPAG